MPPLPLVLSAIARTSPKARTLLHKRHGHFHLIHPSFVPQEGISVVSYLNRRSLDIFTWQLCRQAQGVACGLRPHVFMPERRTAAAPCRAAGEGPRRTEQADEKSSITSPSLAWTFHESHVTSSDPAFLIQNQTPCVTMLSFDHFLRLSIFGPYGHGARAQACGKAVGGASRTPL